MPRKLTREQAIKIREKRDAEDPCLHYVAPVTLQRAGECVSRYICIKSVNQLGKTAFLQYITASVLRGKNKNWAAFGPVKILLVIPKRAQAAEVWGSRLLKACELFGPMGKHPWIPKREVSKVYNSYSPAGPYPGKIMLKNGSSLVTILSGDPNSWKGLEGMTFDLVIRDEVAGNENLGDELQPRLLASRTRALSGLQPWGGIMLWAATETKHNEEWLTFKQKAVDGIEEYAFFNPQPAEADLYVSMKAREEMKNTMSEKSYRIRGSGTLDAGDLVRIFVKQWDDKRHVLPQDYVIKDDDTIHIAWDPGVQHPTGIVISAISRDAPNQIKVVKVFEHSNETVDYDVECIHSFLLGRRIAAFAYDWAAKASHKHAPSLLNTLIAAMDAKGYVPLAGYIQADKRVEPGIDSVRHYLDPKPFDPSATPLLVLNPSQESGCPLLRGQIMGYCKTEPTAGSPGKIVKKNDDALDCLPAGTLIAAEFGEVPIERIRVGDMVWTRAGLRRVSDAWCSSGSSPIVSVTVNGAELRATPGHLIWTHGDTWKRMDKLTHGDTLRVCQTSSSSRASNTMRGTGDAPVASVTAGASYYTGASGSLSTDQYRTGWSSTTKTVIAATTTLPTWSACPLPTTAAIMALSQPGLSTLTKSAILRSNGTDRRRASPGTQATEGTPTQSGSYRNRSASNAKQSSHRSTLGVGASALTHARPSGADTPESTMSRASARSAAHCSRPTSTPSEHDASPVAQPCEPARVYDLTVEGEHEFFANGVLVHNCLRYQVRTFPYWSAAYCCGPTTFAAPFPLQADPFRVNSPKLPQTPLELRIELSKKLSNRTRSSVMQMYGPKR